MAMPLYFTRSASTDPSVDAIYPPGHPCRAAEKATPKEIKSDIPKKDLPKEDK